MQTRLCALVRPSRALMLSSLSSVTHMAHIASAQQQKAASAPVAGYRVVKVYPHDRQAFTQGLQYLDGVLYEGTGQHGQSGIRKVKLETGEVLQHQPLDAEVLRRGNYGLGQHDRPTHVAVRDRIRLRQGHLQADRRPSATRVKAGA